ncbi:MAG: hypothetical protein B0A82_01680 [Alkalinema sp. CACIAM 70d]|nr:MAG: hypothetical protein B0A82_01680 [Alkalinema sp. CACIAM 70d]
MQVKVNYTGQTQFQVIARNHVSWSDHPFRSGGTDIGMTPSEWLLGAIGTCAGAYVVQYCEAQGIDPKGLTMTVFGQVENLPQRINYIRVEVHIPHPLEFQHITGIKQVIESSLIHNTLSHSPVITTEIIAETLKLPQTAATN